MDIIDYNLFSPKQEMHKYQNNSTHQEQVHAHIINKKNKMKKLRKKRQVDTHIINKQFNKNYILEGIKRDIDKGFITVKDNMVYKKYSSNLFQIPYYDSSKEAYYDALEKPYTNTAYYDAYRHCDLDRDLKKIKKVIKLFNRSSFDVDKIKIVNKYDKDREVCGCCDGGNTYGYTVEYNNKSLVTVNITVSETRYPELYTSGEDFVVNLHDYFDKLYTNGR
jgi:hypothetical protein